MNSRTDRCVPEGVGGLSPPVLSIIGRSGCGKTTLLEKLLPVLRARGLAVATLKHHAHQDGADRPGKDTWRHFAAGAVRVGLISPSQAAYFERLEQELPPEEFVARFFQGVDVVLTEGFKKGPFRKLELARRELSTELISSPAEGLIAVIADFEPETKLPLFGLEEIEKIADFVEKIAMAESGKRDWSVVLKVNGKTVETNPFVQSALAGIIEGYLGALNDIPAPASKIEISIERGSAPKPRK